MASFLRPEPAQAERFWQAHKHNAIDGRCVRIGYDNTVSPTQHYHWAICEAADGELIVEEFWNDEVWTTERYRAVLHERWLSHYREREQPQKPQPRRRRWWELRSRE